jgi:hypothetical protein
MSSALPVCYHCRERGHIMQNCPQTSNRCSRCGSALAKALACTQCITSTNGRVNPVVLIAERNRGFKRANPVFEIYDSDDEVSPAKQPLLVVPRKLGPASKTDRAIEQLFTTTEIKKERESPSNAQPTPQGMTPEPQIVLSPEQQQVVPPEPKRVVSPQQAQSPKPGRRIHYVQLSQMDLMAIRSTILRDYAQWPANYDEYRMKIDLQCGPFCGEIRVQIIPSD